MLYHDINTQPWDAWQQHIELHYPQYAQQYPPQRYQGYQMASASGPQLLPDNIMPTRDPFQALVQSSHQAGTTQQPYASIHAKPIDMPQAKMPSAQQAEQYGRANVYQTNTVHPFPNHITQYGGQQVQNNQIADNYNNPATERGSLTQDAHTPYTGYAFTQNPAEANSGERKIGINSGKYPISLSGINAFSGFAHYLYNQGQPIIIPFNTINFKGLILKDYTAFNKVAKDLISTKSNIKMLMTFDTSPNAPNFHSVALGHIIVQIKGTLTVSSRGNWFFDGQILPAYGDWNYNTGTLPSDKFVEVYDFNKANRSWLKEELTTFGRNSSGTDYKIYFRVNKNTVIQLKQKGVLN